MAVVQGIKEKVHLPIYDCFTIEPEKQLRDTETSSILKFFVDVQRKTKLETNLQSAGLLPHYNTFEARALRVVFSDLPPEYPDGADGEFAVEVEDLTVTGTKGADEEKPITASKNDAGVKPSFPGVANETQLTAKIEISLDLAMRLLKEARDSDDGTTTVGYDDDGVTTTFLFDDGEFKGSDPGDVADDIEIELGVADIEDALDNMKEGRKPAPEQISDDDAQTSIIGKLLYNTVTSLYVGEKLMISMPTWFFPSGAGPYSDGKRFTTNGEPNPMATFRFAEPIFVDRQQNFRVEIEVPDTTVLKEIQRIYGPMFIWVVLDGYMTRDVQ